MAFQIIGDLDRPGNTRETCDKTIIISCTISAVDDKMITYSLSAYRWLICLCDLALRPLKTAEVMLGRSVI